MIHAQHLPSLVRDAARWRLLPAYAALHAVAAFVGLQTVIPGTIAATLWPAGGLLLAACVSARRRQRWALLSGAVIAELVAVQLRDALASTSGHLGVALYWAVAHAGVYGLAALLIERWWQVPLPAGLSKLARGTGIVSLVVLAVLSTAAVPLVVLADLPYGLVPTILVGEMLGTIAVTPVVLSWWMAWSGHRGRVAGSRAELAVLVASGVVATAGLQAAQWDSLQPAYLFVPILLWAAMRYPPRFGSLIGLSVATATTVIVSRGATIDLAAAPFGTSPLLSLQIFLLTLLICTTWVSVANYERRLAEDSLRHYAQALTSADARARRSTATDLHDGISQELAGLHMLLALARRKSTDPEMARDLAKSAEVLARISERTKNLIAEIDPPWVYVMSLPDMLAWLAERFAERAGLHVDVQIRGEPACLEPSDRELLYRCTRELLQNVVKHAGVGQALVELQVVDGALHLGVTDAGRGFDARFDTAGEARGGFGLFSIREQLAARGGVMHVRTSPRRGCTVTLVWPQ